jgi:hypothetical protein
LSHSASPSLLLSLELFVFFHALATHSQLNICRDFMCRLLPPAFHGSFISGIFHLNLQAFWLSSSQKDKSLWLSAFSVTTQHHLRS